MIDRIERVTRIKETPSIDPERDFGRFHRKEGYEDSQKEKNHFGSMLDQEIAKRDERPQSDAGPNAPRAYELELSVRPTQSLFYQQQGDAFLRDHLKEAGRRLQDAG